MSELTPTTTTDVLEGRDEHRDFGWRGEDPPSTRYLHRKVVALAEPLDDRTRALDLGCGNGYLLARLAERGAGVLVGLDVAEDGVALARKRVPRARIERFLADETVLERLGEAPFDVVFSTEVVEHVFDPHAWARACFAALRPGGVLVCSTPYHGYLKNLVIGLVGGWDTHHQPLKVGGHIKFFSTKTLRSLLEQNGFEFDRSIGAGRVPGLWKSMIVRARRPDAS